MNGEVASVLEVVSLSKRYAGQLAIADVDLSIRPGEVLGLIGPNGAGKTTLLESIAGLLPVDSGRVTWTRRPLSTQQRREVMFYLPDAIRPLPDQSLVKQL